ncbi:flagellar protein [Bacillus sp. FJAT-42376]|uniref:TIGR02530 family flagellar biosynthesis protein n=1 Tax=Bacillus sp. FJAT-42376 TaxID=2014076 RepID=UPI000F4FA32F|nr:TIGR02530 family flagellar biosynthesis protein [Bacillus sp. FJAT-42376]AZB42944.1 flagellar protein [Bacillus sp. FJAT-42376]
MENRIDYLQHPPLSIYRPNQGKKADTSFQSLLKEKMTISKHAQARLDERNITISAEKWNKLEDSLSKAKEKGIQDALVLSNEGAFIVSVKNSTMITAMNRKEAASQIFTNINGTIILD